MRVARTAVRVSALIHASWAFTAPSNRRLLAAAPMMTAAGAPPAGASAAGAPATYSKPTTYTLKRRNPYDCHVYYRLDDGSRDEALALREAMRLAFPWMRFHRPFDRPIGPHPLPMWEADFASYENRDRWPDVVAWLEAHHGRLSVLVHPHSTDSDYADHTAHAFWAGDVLPLRMRPPA
jgi:DOPA 4,5-dioxygenase